MSTGQQNPQPQAAPQAQQAAAPGAGFHIPPQLATLIQAVVGAVLSHFATPNADPNGLQAAVNGAVSQHGPALQQAMQGQQAQQGQQPQGGQQAKPNP